MRKDTWTRCVALGFTGRRRYATASAGCQQCRRRRANDGARRGRGVAVPSPHCPVTTVVAVFTDTIAELPAASTTVMAQVPAVRGVTEND